MSEEILRIIEEDVLSRSKSNQKRRRESLLSYYSNPKYCKFCGKMIFVLPKEKTREVLIRSFCNHSCSASYNNSLREKREQEKKKKEPKIKPGVYTVDSRTKKELFDKCLNWQSARSSIRKRAQQIYESSDKPKRCMNCGYERHYEVCHIKPVSDFSDDSLISEINNINNLVALCPNCHWEFDNDLLDI